MSLWLVSCNFIQVLSRQAGVSLLPLMAVPFSLISLKPLKPPTVTETGLAGQRKKLGSHHPAFPCLGNGTALRTGSGAAAGAWGVQPGGNCPEDPGQALPSPGTEGSPSGTSAPLGFPQDPELRSW